MTHAKPETIPSVTGDLSLRDRVRSPQPPASVIVSMAGNAAHGCVAVTVDGRLTLVCPLERLSRLHHGRTREDALVDAIHHCLSWAGVERQPDLIVTTDNLVRIGTTPARPVARRNAQIGLASLYAAGAECFVLVCDADTAPWGTLWHAGPETRQLAVLEGPSAEALLTEAARGLRLSHLPPTQREALARCGQPSRMDEAHRIVAAQDPSALAGWLAPLADASPDVKAELLTSLQHALVSRLIDLVTAAGAPKRPLVLVGNLFRNTFFTTALAMRWPDRVIVPPDPGVAGEAVGALAAVGAIAGVPSPFAGPAFNSVETKALLDGCKLEYDFIGTAGALERTVKALRRGWLVAWFEGGMEWGPRALGHRSIFADATNPFVRENLNVHLKKRPHFMTYALSITDESAADLLDGPAGSAWMQFECAAKRIEPLRHFLPPNARTFRAHTVSLDHSSLRTLLDAYDSAYSVPFLVNTSFNAVGEPLVCSPLDAIRCFFSSGLDVLMLNGFVLSK